MISLLNLEKILGMLAFLNLFLKVLLNPMSIIFNITRIALALFSLVSLVASSVLPATAKTLLLADVSYTSTTPVVSRVWVEEEGVPASESVEEEKPEAVPTPKVLKVLYREVTAYTSDVAETDDSPRVAADGSVVFDGMVASNGLPFGTKIRLPDYFGDKVFEVRDRMNTRYPTRIDIWMENKKDMYQWGYKRSVKIEVIEMGNNKHRWNDPEMKEARKQLAMKTK